jgi:hypothetical protein
LNHLHDVWILGKDGGDGNAIKLLFRRIQVSIQPLQVVGQLFMRRNRHEPSLMLATPGCWAWEERGALLAGVFWGVLEGRLANP